MPTKRTDKKISLDLSEEEISVLIMVIRMGGYHRLKEYGENMRGTDNPMVITVSRLLKKLEKTLKN